MEGSPHLSPSFNPSASPNTSKITHAWHGSLEWDRFVDLAQKEARTEPIDSRFGHSVVLGDGSRARSES